MNNQGNAISSSAQAQNTEAVTLLIIEIQKNGPSRRELEERLLGERNNLGQVISLCGVIEAMEGVPQNSNISIFAAVELKNIFKIFYDTWIENQTEQVALLLEQIKQKIFELYVRTGSKSVRLCLLECLQKVLSSNFYPHCWPQFLPLAKHLLSKGDPDVNYRVFKTFVKLTEKYLTHSRSAELKQEMGVVISEIHGTLLEEIKLRLTRALSGSGISKLELKLMSLVLQSFYCCIYHELYDVVGQHIYQWNEVLKVILSPEMKQKVFAVLPNEEETSKNLFGLKGECVRLILLISRKYKKSFDYDISAFINEIWAHCVEDSKRVGSKIIMFSIRYFKSIACFEQNAAYFQNKMKDILVHLVIPRYTFCEKELEIFEYEAESFVETIFTRHTRCFRSEREEIQKFVICLGKFHRESILPLMGELFGSLVVDDPSKLDEDSIFQRVAFLNMLVNVSAYSSNLRNGIRWSLSPAELITGTFDHIVVPLTSTILKNMPGEPPIKFLFIMAQIFRFLGMFRYYLPTDKLIELLVFIYQAGIHLKEDSPGLASYSKTLFVLTRHILEMKKFTVDDKTNLDQTNMNFHKRCYVSPRVLVINHQPKILLLPSDHPCMASFCEFLYTYFTREDLEVQQQALSLFRVIIQRLGDRVAGFCDPFLKIYSSFIQKIAEDKICLNFGLISQIFESLSALIRLSAVQPSAAELILPVLSRATLLFSKNEPDLHAVVFQVFAVFVDSFKIEVVPSSSSSPTSLLFQQSSLGQFVQFCLEVNNYSNDFINCSEVYLQVLSICGKYSPNVITQNWAKVSAILQFLIQKKMHSMNLHFLRDLILGKLIFPELVQFLLNYMQHMMGVLVGNDTLVEVQIFLRENLITLLTLIEVQGVTTFFGQMAEVQGLSVLRQFLVHPQLIQLIQSFGINIQRRYLMVVFSGVFFDEYQQSVSWLTLEGYKTLINALITNVFAKKFNRKSLRDFRSEAKEFEEKVNTLSSGAFRKIPRFKDLEPVHQKHIKAMSRQMIENQLPEDTMFLQKITRFSQTSGVHLDQLLTPENLNKLVQYNYNQNK